MLPDKCGYFIIFVRILKAFLQIHVPIQEGIPGCFATSHNTFHKGPCSGFAYEQPRQIAFKLATEIQAAVPRIGTVQDSKDLRGDEVYIDTTLNDYADTLAAAYSIRPYPQPLVSTPLGWKEVKRGLDRYAFTIDTIQARLKKKGGLWRDLFSNKIIAANNNALRPMK
jgi:bifunctional non-homologous end joining protein LigD